MVTLRCNKSRQRAAAPAPPPRYNEYPNRIGSFTLPIGPLNLVEAIERVAAIARAQAERACNPHIRAVNL